MRRAELWAPTPSGAGCGGVCPEGPALAMLFRVLFPGGSLEGPRLSTWGRSALPPAAALTVPLPPLAEFRLNWHRNTFLSRATQEGIKTKANSCSTLPHSCANVGVAIFLLFLVVECKHPDNSFPFYQLKPGFPNEVSSGCSGRKMWLCFFDFSPSTCLCVMDRQGAWTPS